MVKFKPTNESVDELISKLKSKQKQEDAQKLVELYSKISAEEAVVWYPGIIGFGKYRYKNNSGIEVETPLLAFAPRQAKISLYIDTELEEREKLLAKLGKHKQAVGCVYVNKLADIDLAVLEEILEKSILEHSSRNQERTNNNFEVILGEGKGHSPKNRFVEEFIADFLLGSNLDNRLIAGIELPKLPNFSKGAKLEVKHGISHGRIGSALVSVQNDKTISNLLFHLEFKTLKAEQISKVIMGIDPGRN